MKKVILATDLDNTLIFSFKRKAPMDICVEINKDKPQSYMTPKSVELFEFLAQKINLIPVTTRSVEQYQRIKFPIPPSYALTTNGAILLYNGNYQKDWCTASKKIIEPYYEKMKHLCAVLSEQGLYVRTRIVDERYVFAYCADGVNSEHCAESYYGTTDLIVQASGRKLYFFPPQIDKGTAVQKLKQFLGGGMLICAGDSRIDVPMLEQADLALVPTENMASYLKNPNVQICPPQYSFSEFVLEQTLEVVQV